MIKAHLLDGTCKLYTYADNSDMLMSYNGESFTYDCIGNPVTYRSKVATWAYGRQMTGFDSNTFAYDARGRRIAKNNITFTYDSNGNLIKQSDGLEFFYDHTGVFAVKYNSSTYFYRKDALGNIVALLDTNGSVVVKYKYDAWGKCIIDASTTNTELANLNPFRYRGYYYDVETELYFLKTRYYDPETGRFITIDDISYLDPESINGLNLYAYCRNNPVMCVDPSGHLAFFVLTMLIGAAIGFGITTAVDYFDDGNVFNGSVHWGWYLGATLLGAAIGAGIGMAISYSATGTLTADIRWISAFRKAAKGDYSKLLKLSTKNPNSKYVSVGRYVSKSSSQNYINIAKRNNFTYFDMGKNYGIADKKGIAQTINKLFIQEQNALGKIFYKTSTDIAGSYAMELELLEAIGAIVLSL